MMDYHELIDALTDEGNPNVLDYIDDAVEMLEHLYSELKAANVRCETLSKMVTQYQDELIPGYRERAEKAKRERNAAVKFCGKLFALCSPPQKWWPKLFRRLPARVGDYMGSGYSFVDSANRIIDEFTETAEESLYNDVRRAAEEEAQKYKAPEE